MQVKPDPVAPGQESVWDYPRPAVAMPTSRRLEIVHRGVTLAATNRGMRTLETSHPPTYYFPPCDVAPGALTPNARRSICEWKGAARYFDVHVAGETFRDAAWSYPDPTPGFAALTDFVAFYPRLFDGCFVDGERAEPQAGGFYGGWITRDLAGPFKGGPGTMGW
ncbi:DUF427 domain-containing protein [Aurantimonas sp. Leaf443]|uniref:DUF427 domain-containing protein n=1 Tax=Aurantimonas sp. Leaf443 TaxID=1736378 RepID=UPI0006FF89AD|nr:DUF427 domain-containing protein [Aurantimonas sp. Leaf443]KQT85431.1 hypothetical protein ASG48_09360 [Aurantimonas sp. Leaf443]